MREDFIDFMSVFVSTAENIGLFLWSLVKFLTYAFLTLFNFVFKTFEYIFSDTLFDGIGTTFQNLALYFGGPSALIFISLFLIAFLLIIVSFIFKFMKGTVNYKATLKKFNKK